MGIVRLALSGGLIILMAACNTTSRMKIPRPSATPLLALDSPAEGQPTFALAKVVATIKRGTPVLHFPAAGVDGAAVTFCNTSHVGEIIIDWRGGSTTMLGDWRDELGEAFYDAVSGLGLNVAGDPHDLFGRAEAANAAEYQLGARITEIRGNMCQKHILFDVPREEFAGEIYVAVEWTVFSSLRKEEVLTVDTQGYFLQKQPKRDGVIIAFTGAFSAAAENLLASRDFVALAEGRAAGPAATVAEKAGPARTFVAADLATEPLDSRLDAILPAVVTVRVGRGHGTGFAISEDGLILTNQHVVGNAERASIILSNGIEVVGDVLARSAVRDVALIKIGLRIPKPLPVRLERPAPPEKVFVVGTPIDESLRSTVTTGVVSAVRAEARSGLTFIQSDAAISPGNSGGPMLDGNGNVIGISVQKVVGRSAESLNMFIPIGEALQAINLRPVPRSS